MLLFWLGIFFHSLLGIFLYPVYAEQNRELWPFILGIGVALNIAGCYRTKIWDCQLPTANCQLPLILFLIPLALGIYSFRFPYNLPLYMAGTGIILVYALRWRMLRPASTGVLVSGVILSFQTASVIPYLKFAARHHEINLFNPFFYWILKGLGVSCAYSQDTIFVQTTQANLELVTSWEKLGLFVFVTYIIGILVFFYIASGRLFQSAIWKKAGLLFSIMAAYIIARYIFLSLTFIEINKAEIFWMPMAVAGSFFPLPFILWRFFRLDSNQHNTTDKDACAAQLPTANCQLGLGIAMFIFSFSLVSCLSFQDPGALKRGRILMDEYYSDWEWTDKEFDTEWYGVQSVYNYYCFANYLNHFFSVERLKEAITDEKLANCDVFIIKTPTSPFTDKEIDSIERYVKNGGGLFLIGDHTNVFGTTINLNPLAGRFRFRFNYDATYDLITSDLHFHKQNALYRHPSVKEMPYFLFATSCSMSAPFFAEDAMIASNLKTMYLDYSRGGYFPDKNTVLNYTFGLFLQSSGVKFGKGRVLTFCDSTCFSNFYMHIPGKPEYALGSINWLNRMNHYDLLVKAVSSVLMAVSFGFIICLFISAANHALKRLILSSFVRVLLFAGLFGAVSSAMFCNLFSSRCYGLPESHTPMTRIGFEEKYCDFSIPSVQLLHNPAIDFQTFYVWPQRLGYIPALFSLNDSLDDFDMIVMVNPQQYFSEKETKKIVEYIANGGKLLLIDHPKGVKSTANQIAEQYGLKVDYKQFQEKAEIYEGDDKLGQLRSVSPIEGGQPLLFTGDKKPFISIVKHGKGMIAVMACSPSFTNEEMGETEAIPDDHQQFLYKLEFWIFTSMIRGDFSLFSDFTADI